MVLYSSRVFDPAETGRKSSRISETDLKPFKELKRSPSDEVLLTELAWDSKNFKIYDMSSMITVGELANSTPFATFKCYFDKDASEFFIEINENTSIELFTRSTLLSLLDAAEKEGAGTAFVCFKKGT